MGIKRHRPEEIVTTLRQVEALCGQGMKVRFVAAATLVHELIEAADERRLPQRQKQLAAQDLLIIYELGFLPLSKTVAELLFEVISQR